MDSVRTIARTVLYEGYLLWPYRRSALKNQHRFTLGGLYPAAYAARSSDRAHARFDALLEGDDAVLDVEVRFLRLLHRQVLRDGTPVDEATACGERYVSWDEATEETVELRDVDPDAGAAREIALDPRAEDESIGGGVVLRRTAEALRGTLALAAERVATGVRRVGVTVANTDASGESGRDDALRRTFLACHVVLRARGGAFVSALDAPGALRDAADACRSEGLWPVLAGEPPDRTTLFAAPMILEDYPRIAPESPGDHFDGGEIDELLVHSIRALTDAEHDEIRATDPHARELLERALALSPDAVGRLHGAVREMRPVQR